jgi:uncharacterized DUF497 family protein
MEIEFDPDKEATNLAKHKISLARAADIDVRGFRRIERNGERRLKVVGLLDGHLYTLILVFRRNSMRAISLRRAHEREVIDVQQER